MNQYHIYEAIGRGKHSTVYKGRKKKTIDYYAIKSVEKTQKSRVLQEVRTLHSLDHPNVLKFYAWYETSAHLWLVLEYCVGGDLLTLLRQDTSLPEESIHDFARDLVQALQFLHSKGVIYCDLKPSNVLLDENGRLKLCDFGLARRLSDISKSSVQQLPQAKRGTPCYMAPELFQEGGVHSFSSDLWALGCVMYECYAGRPPFVSTSFTQLVSHILSEPTPSLQGSPSKELEDLVGRLLIKDPAQRLQWPELREHPFWRTKFKSLPLPPQPAFQKMTSHGAEFGALKHSATVNTTSEKIIPDEQISSQQGRSTMKKGPGQAVYKKGPALHAKGAGATENTPAQQPFNQSKVPGYVAPLREDSGRTNGAVNLLRLSKIVKSNLQRETEGGNYRQQGPKNAGSGTDITIENNDLELDFAEQTEDDGDDEDDGTRALTSAGSDGSEDNTSSIAEKGQSKIEHDQAANFKVQAPVGQYPKMNGNDHETLKAVEAQAAKLEAVRLEAAATPPGLGQPRKAQRFAIFGDQKKATPTSAIQGSAEHAKPCLILSQALWHSSDLAVRPVMIFRRNEKMAETTYDARMLPVESLSSSELLKLPPEHLETFVNKVVVGVNSHTPLVEKLNTLKYLEGLCTNVDAANILINGPIMNMLIKMLRTSKPPTLRVQLVCVMGLLIRHATLIDEELANSGIIAVLTEGLRDKQDKMRRCSMATLGELLFYIATQSDSSPRSGAGNDSSTKDVKSSSTWQVPNTLIALVSSILRKGEDDITQHYALKTIENVASQGGEWAARFTSHDVLENLCYIFKASVKQENLRSTAGSCLVRLVRFSPSNIPLVLEKLTFKDLVAGLTKGSPKEQQVNVNLLNMALMGSSVINNMGKYLLALLEEKSLVPSLVAMLEQGTEVLRGKAFVCAALLCKINRKWLPSLCNAKLLPTVERLTKEKDTYVQQCVEALVQTLVGVVPGILESISMDIQQLSSGKRPSSVASHGTVHNGRSQIRSSIPLFPVVLHLFSSPIFRHRIVNEHILKQLTGFMNRLETSFFQGEDEFQLTLLRIIEVIGQESSVLLGFPEIFILQILPSLAILYKKNTDGDMRFLCLKILFDSLVVFLDNVSNSATTERNEGSSHAPLRMEEISQISKQHFLPLYPTLIEDEDPIPMYAQNLLVMLLDIKCIKVSDLFHLMPLSKFFDFLCADLSSITLHSVRLCLFLASAAEVETSVLSELRLVGRVGGLLDFVHAKGMDDFLDPSLSLCRSFLIRSCAKGNVSSAKDVNSNCTQSSSIQDISEFGRYAGVFLELCSSKEPHIAEAAAECLVLVVNATPRGLACTLISCLSLLAKALESCTKFHAPHVVSQIQRRLLLVLCAICKEQRMSHEISIPPEVSTSDIDALQSIVTGLRKSNSQTVADAAIDAALELQLLPHRS